MQNKLLQDWLRLPPEPCIHIDELEVHRTLLKHGGEFMETLRYFYTHWPTEAETIQLPIKQVFSSEDCSGDFRVMPCTISSRKLKMVKIIGTNEEQRTIHDKICVGKAALIDYYDNHIFALMDVCALSSFRTAAITCLAFHALHGSKQSVGLLGAGRIGFYTAYLLNQWCHIDRLAVTDPDLENLNRFHCLCNHYLPELTVDIRQQDDIMKTSSALFLATTSSEAICHKKNSRHLSFISSVGADADNLSEIDSSLLSSHQLLTDSAQSSCLGDMKRWRNDGLLHDGMITELKEVLTHHKKLANHALFISTGVALQDALICQFIYDKLEGQTTNTLFAQKG